MSIRARHLARPERRGTISTFCPGPMLPADHSSSGREAWCAALGGPLIVTMPFFTY